MNIVPVIRTQRDASVMNVPRPELSLSLPDKAAPLRCPTGVASLDAALGGGLAAGRIHEIHAAEPDDGASAAGFAALLAAGVLGRGKPLVWLRERGAVRASGIVQAEGLLELCGTLPRDCLFVLADDAPALLRAGHDALRCADLGAVLLEARGPMPRLDLTASRRLLLAAERTGVTLLLLRIGAQPVPSAADTRWSVSAAPSRALPANAPGAPTFDLALLRQRAGPSGLSWRLEWNRDQRIFEDAALFEPVVSVPADRPAAGGTVVPFPNAA